MNLEEINQFEQTQAQMEGLYTEISNLSKKKPDDAINKFKLSFINRLLLTSNEILADDYRPFSEFDSFDEDELPTNSDVAMILSQYLSCFEKLRADNITLNRSYATWYWIIDEKESSIKTSPPKKIKK